MKPKLLIIINRFVIGGQASDTIPLLYHLQDKYHIKILYGEKEADEIQPLFLLEKYPGLEILKITSLKRTVNPFSDVVTLYTLYKFIKKFKPDIIHTHGAKSGLLGRLAAWISRVPIIIHTFHGHLFHSYFNRFTTGIILKIEKALGRITDAAIALSPSQKLEIVQQFSVFPQEKVHVIPLGIDINNPLTAPAKSFREEYNLLKSDVAIAIIGRIVPIKNHLDFLKIAVNILQKENSNCRFFIVGDGHRRDELFLYLEEMRIPFSLPAKPDSTAKIIFTSWISDMVNVIQQLDIIVLTSHNEGTPVSLIEAQLCAKPVVAYNVGGAKDTFIDGESGFLVDKGDIDGFVSKLQLLINDEQLRSQFGARGKEYCVAKFSKQAEITAIDNLYTMLLAKKAGAL